MKITVLLSSYNGEKYIREQIESLLSQTVTVDIFVRDDGSLDETVGILEGYKQAGKLDYFACKNVGVTKSFFELLKLAPLSDYYAFCDQDDVWDNNKVETAIAMLKRENNEVPLLYLSAVRPVDKDLNILSIAKSIKNRKFELTFGESLVQSVAAGCTFVFNEKTRLLIKDDDTEKISIHDWYMHKAVAAFGKLIYDDVPHISYRQHLTNAIGIKKKSIFSKMKAFLTGKSKNVRYYDAVALATYHMNEMSEETKKILSTVVGYKKSFKYKIALIKNKKIKMATKKNNFFLFFVIIFGIL